MREWILPALGSIIFWGSWRVIPKFTTRYIDPKSAVVFEIFGGVIFGLALLYTMGFRPEMDARGVSLGLLGGIIGFIGGFCYILALSKGPASVVVGFTALNPVITILLTFIILNEPITLRQGTGLLLAPIVMYLLAAP